MNGPLICGEDHGGPVLTVRALKDFIARIEAHGQDLDGHLVHLMRMDDDRGDDWPDWKDKQPKPSADTLRERARCRAIVLKVFGSEWKGNEALEAIDRGTK